MKDQTFRDSEKITLDLCVVATFYHSIEIMILRHGFLMNSGTVESVHSRGIRHWMVTLIEFVIYANGDDPNTLIFQHTELLWILWFCFDEILVLLHTKIPEKLAS